MGFMLIIGVIYNTLLLIGFDIAPIISTISTILMSIGF